MVMGSHLQLLLIALCGIAVVLLLRVIFSSDEQQTPSKDDHVGREDRRFTHSFAGSTTDGSKESAPVSNDLGRVRVTQFNFSHFDAIPGPPDPENFADELILELYDSISDFRWTATYVVATPAGIRKLMDDENWKFFYATEIFVVRRYDLQVIREAVFGRLNEIHEKVPLDPEEPPLRA